MTTMWPIVQVRSTLKTILYYRDLLDHVRSMMKTKQDNDMINRIGIIYTKNKTELSEPIKRVQSMTKTR